MYFAAEIHERTAKLARIVAHAALHGWKLTSDEKDFHLPSLCQMARFPDLAGPLVSKVDGEEVYSIFTCEMDSCRIFRVDVYKIIEAVSAGRNATPANRL